jgi:pimeloyl-ACP methyl ester carboxylesterase
MKNAFLFVFLSLGICRAQVPIDTAEEIHIGGIRQFITMEGRDRELPLLLFLHGGPGGSVLDYAEKFSRRLKDHFVVVHWDQRETGRTLDLNPSPVPLSFELFQKDTRELIDTLLKRFHRQKLYLVAHSWGTALGFHIARYYPDLLYAYVPIGAMIDQLGSERIALALMKDIALKKGNEKALAELGNVRIPFEDGRQLYFHRKWLLDLAGSRRVLKQAYVEQWATRWLPVFAEASRENLFHSLPSVACPVYFLAGKKDYQTNSWLAEKYFNTLSAPRKAFFWFDTGHGIPSSDPEGLQSVIIGTVLPETFTIRKPAALISTQ